MITTVDAECPACGETIQVEFDPDCLDEQEVTCDQCAAVLSMEAYDPVKKVLVLEVLEDEEDDFEEDDDDEDTDDDDDDGIEW